VSHDRFYESLLEVTDVMYLDTGLFTCSYVEGGTVTNNSSSVYVYVKGKLVKRSLLHDAL